jgi:predicted O-methyltransferase YrrM
MRVPETATKVQRRLRDLEVDIVDAKALHALSPLSGHFLPWTDFTMRPSAILAVVNDVALRRRQSIVECGSGNSTLYVARLLAQHRIEGHIHSLEHDARWASVTREGLRREGLEAWATVTHAPLLDGWYDVAALPRGITAVDLLVVDGPPAHSAELQHSRERSLDVFRDRLTADATIFLDDAHRPGERQVLAGWRRRHGIALEHHPGGYASVTLGD